MARFAATIKAASLLTMPTLLRIMATRLPDFDVDAELAAMAADEQARADAAAMEMERIAANAQMTADDEADQDGGE